jgi:hypothetical protein
MGSEIKSCSGCNKEESKEEKLVYTCDGPLCKICYNESWKKWLDETWPVECVGES